jgi:hypothetical protein
MYLETDQNSSDTVKDKQKIDKRKQLLLDALEILSKHVHDDLIWILESCADPESPYYCFKALEKELGKQNKDPKTEIQRVEKIVCNGRNLKAFFQNVSTAINDLRQAGVPEARFGKREEADLLISGLTHKSFKELRSTLLANFAADPAKADPDQLKTQIEIFISKSAHFNNETTEKDDK